MIVTRGTDREQVAKLRRLAPDDVPVVMSSQAWQDYAVPGTPYFVLVEDGAIRGEGVATTWTALASLLSDAIEDAAGARRSAGGGRGRAGPPEPVPGGPALTALLVLGCAAAVTAAVASAWSP